MYNPSTRSYLPDIGDRLDLFMPSINCSKCHRHYICFTDIEIALELCASHRHERADIDVKRPNLVQKNV